MSDPLATPLAAPSENHFRRRFQGIPGIQGTPKGRLYATWYGGGQGEGADNFVMVATSDDDGATWSDLRWVVDVAAPDTRAYDPTAWLDPQGRLWLFWSQTRSDKLWHIFDGRAGVWAAVCENPDDPEPAWSMPRRIADGVMMNKPVALANGDWALPVAIWADGVGGGHPAPELEACKGPGMVVSRDHGQTFDRLGAAKVRAPTFDEHHIVERRDGTLWMTIRTGYGVAQSFSSDGGVTWSAAGAGPVFGPDSRFFVRRLSSGRLLLVNHKVNPLKPFERSHLTAWLSDDDGVTWQGELLLDPRVGVSYPDGFEDKTGRIFVVYDRDRQGDGDILLARFREEDVASGRFHTADAVTGHRISGNAKA